VIAFGVDAGAGDRRLDLNFGSYGVLQGGSSQARTTPLVAPTPAQEATMRSFLVALTAVSFIISAYSSGQAADDKKLTPQQEKMKSCNAEAGDKKGDERKAFMSSCLKAGARWRP
jgi:hypothetical protein